MTAPNLGWVRPATLGLLDGCTTQLAMLAFASGALPHRALLLGMAGWLAGSMSMSVNEYVSVSDQNRAEGTSYSPMTAALASFAAFSIGALVPLVPLAVGAAPQWGAVTALACLFVSGAFLSRYTGRSWHYAGFRQLLAATAGCAVVFVIGHLIGTPI